MPSTADVDGEDAVGHCGEDAAHVGLWEEVGGSLTRRRNSSGYHGAVVQSGAISKPSALSRCHLHKVLCNKLKGGKGINHPLTPI